MHVLIIEDNVDAATTLGMLLELLGHRAHVAHDGTAGVQAARDLRPDAVICDIGLPGALDGYGVAQVLRAELPSALLVALTGYGQEDVQRRARAAGFDLHLTKPVEAQVLERILAEYAERLEAAESKTP